MCGRYAFFLRPSEIRRQFQDANMPADEVPEDDEVRETYNFAPGYHGLVYRAAVPDTGAGTVERQRRIEINDGVAGDVKIEKDDEGATNKGEGTTPYRLQSMKWGLIPFWIKRNPDYGSMMKTINCRDDSLLENRGMWTSMKKNKRCIVMCQGFYEWLKKNGGKEKIPHFIKRKDGQLMCMAGLWDCVQYESDSDEKHYTYTIITTDSNKQLNFLHDRMPVILDNGSDDLFKWLDPNRTDWTRELQSLLKPYQGDLEIYPVSKDVGKVGNNSPTFIIPIDSTENKSNIANFFGNQQKMAKTSPQKKDIIKAETKVEDSAIKLEKDPAETRATEMETESTEDNAPLPKAGGTGECRGVKREHTEDIPSSEQHHKARKTSDAVSSPSRSSKVSPAKSARPSRSATSNNLTATSSRNKTDAGTTPKITNFFGK